VAASALDQLHGLRHCAVCFSAVFDTKHDHFQNRLCRVKSRCSTHGEGKKRIVKFSLKIIGEEGIA
jgi:hypothetical protein